MFFRSLIFVAALSVASAQAAWSCDMAHAGKRQHSHASTAKNVPARAYVQAMHTMHKNMGVPRSGNVDVDFVRQMIPHHQGAFAMAKIQQQYGKDAALKQFNDWVITAQTQEIGFMEQWLRRRDNGASNKNARDYFGEAMAAMHHAMAITYTGDADVDYVRGMIAHHQGAVDMAAILLVEGTDPELAKLANDIFSSQTSEIAWMKRWLKKHGQTYP